MEAELETDDDDGEAGVGEWSDGFPVAVVELGRWKARYAGVGCSGVGRLLRSGVRSLTVGGGWCSRRCWAMKVRERGLGALLTARGNCPAYDRCRITSIALL